MKKILILLALLVVMTLVFVSCQDDPKPPVDDTTVADQPTEEPTAGEEDPTQAPDTDPETPAPDTDEPDEPTTPAPETQEPDTPAPDTQAPETPEPETADPMEPVNVFDAEDIQTVTGGDPSNMTQDCLTLEDGYVHVVPIGPDPYWYPFAGVDGARYVAIRYRTDATGADIQMYIASTGSGPSNDSSMLRQPVIADSEWHVAIFDTQSLIDAGIYDGSYVSYFRFDPLEAGYMLNENGEPYYLEGTQTYARYALPEGCMIDVAYIGFFHSEEAVAKYDFEQYPPFSQITDAGMKGHSFDTFYVNGQMYFPEDGQAGSKLDAINNTLTFASAAELENITLRGWIGFDQAIDSFGYYVDNYEFVYGEFKTATGDDVLSSGGEFASRFEIKVPLEYLEGDDHFVGFVVKLADGTVAQLRAEITIDLPELPDDITDSFTSDVNSNEVGTTVDASDLANFFVTELPTGGCTVEANGEGKLYHVTSINDMYADVNGRYFFKANVINSDGAGWMFVRGYRVVNSDAIVEAFDPVGGFYKINNYYETDSAGAMGGAGIYARLGGGKLFLMVKYYNPENITRVGNKIYAIDAAGTELTLADNGSTVSVLVDGVTYATVDLSGSIAYGDINEVDPAGEFAEKAVITLKDGTTETIENTLIAATCECQVGIVARTGSFKFDALAVGAYSAIEVPALEIETPEEPEPVDPDAPVLVLDPEYINELAGSDQQTVAQHIGSHEIITEDGVTFVRLTSNGGDPYVALVKLGSYLELPPYMAFAYRTNCDLDAHVFIGSGSGWNGNGDVASVAWNQDNNWNLAVLDLNNAGLTSIQNGIISYCRFDFFTGNGAGNMDVEYVAFFNSAEAAQKYFDKLHGGTDEPETEEPEVPEEPEFYENLVVPQDQWVISGHCTTLVGKDGHPNSPMVAAGGVDSAALLHQGSIALGNIDLSKYSKVIIYWGSDNGDGTKDLYAKNEHNRFALVNADKNMVMSPAEDTIIAAATYELHGWAVAPIEIDLTGIDYNGPVFLTHDSLAGGFALVYSIEFVGAEKVDEPEHQHEYTTVVTDPTCTEGGYTTYTCACGDSYVADETPAAGHNFVDGFCGICGEADPDYVKPLPSTPEEIVNAAYGLAEGATLEGTYTLTGVITSIDSAYNATYGNISVWIQIGDMSDKPILAYRLSGTGVESLKVGDTITVTGQLTNYYSKIEFTQGCTLDAVVPGEEPEPELPEENTIIIDFSDKANRTEFNANIQVWVNGDFVLTNNKAASTTDVADYANPARFYAHSEIIISGVNMTKLVFACDATKYVTALKNTLANASGISYTDEGMIVTVVFDTPVDSFVLADLTAQIRLDSVTVYVAAAEEPETPDEPAANEITVTTTDNYTWVDVVEFTATVSGTYTFYLPAGLGAFDVDDCDAWPPVGGPYVDYYENAEGASFSIDLAEGETTRFYVGALTKADWVITWTVEEKEIGGGDEPGTEDPEIPVEPADDISGTYSTGGDDTLVIDMAAGTLVYTFTGRGGAMNTVEYGISIADGVVTLSNANGPITGPMAPYMGVLELDENGKPSKFYYNGYTYDVTAAGAVEPEPEQPEIGDLILVVGNNNIAITDEIIAEGGIVYQLVVTEEGTYTVNGDFFVQFQDAMGMTYGNGSYLTAGTYDVRLGTMQISAAGNYNAEVEFTAPEGGDVVEPEPSGNPVIESLPFSYEVPAEGLSMDGVDYDYTAAEQITLVITKPAGGLVSPTATNNWDNDADGNYVLVVNAGETISLNFWSMSGITEGVFTVSVQA